MEDEMKADNSGDYVGMSAAEANAESESADTPENREAWNKRMDDHRRADWLSYVPHGRISRFVSEARERHGEISFCGTAKSWGECTRLEHDDEGWYVSFWYNSADGSTHMIRERVHVEEPALSTQDWLRAQGEYDRRPVI